MKNEGWILIGVALIVLALSGLCSCGGGGTEGECVPDCAGRCCGPDGCGGICADSCGDTGQVCDEGSCTCVGVCTPLTCADLGRECGTWPDSCGGVVDCGDCPGSATCDEYGACQMECVPDCAGRCCGPDGCGGTCADGCAGSEGFCDVSTCTCESVCDYQFAPTTPYRRLDTRSETKLAAGSVQTFELAGRDGIPADAQAVAFNLTAVNPSAAGYATVYAKGTQRPVASNLNYAVGETTTNGVISKVGDSGEVCFYLHSASRLLVDVVGYWPSADACCAAQNCDNPPFIGCTGLAELITYSPAGSCSRGTCDYGHTVTTCSYLCQRDACVAAPDFPFHDRTEWQDPAYPVSSTSGMDINALRYITIHYIGADGVDLSNIGQVLRNAQLDYVINRGYSLGYNSAISPDGDEWEIRGFDYRCAANGEQATNIPSYSILIMLPNTWSVPPPAQIDGVRQLVAKIRATAAAAGNGDFLEINGHRDLKATACPGDVIYAMIQDGTFEP